MMNYVFCALALVGSAVLLFFTNKFWRHRQNLVLKILSLLLLAVFFVRYFAVDSSLFENCYGLSYGLPFSSAAFSALVLIAVWLLFASVVLLQMYPFFQFSLLGTYAKTLGLVANGLGVILLPHISYSFTGTYQLTLCGAMLGVEIGLSLAYTIDLWLTTARPSRHDWLVWLCTLPLALLFAMPPYAMHTFVGTIGLGQVDNFGFYHRAYLYLGLIFLFGIYFLLRRKDPTFCRMVLLYIALTTLISYVYDYDFSIFIRPTSWPLHLCNTAMFIIPLCLIFKWDRLFYFTFFINVLGAALAMLLPDYSTTAGAFGVSMVCFWINHIMAFAMPLLIVFLRVYPRPNLRYFIYSMVGFLIYFLLVLFINAWFTNYKADIDFFFINSDFIASKLGTWAENTRKIVASFQINELTLTFYPLYQFLFFTVYVALGAGMWFVYAEVFQIQDFYLDLERQRRKIKAEQRSVKPMEQNQATINQLVVSHVSKRYGNSPHYASNDISFTVKAGEILGFLGPNGAGKSTMIKCIVGIQPPTSGSISINGYDIIKQPVAAKAQFGFVPDHYALYENLTGREYLNYVADLYDVTRADRDARLAQLTDQLQMEQNIDAPIRTYSHGMKQKITIMSALIHEPKLWILDEPLTGLDPDSIYQVKECMKAHAAKGNIVLFSSHIIDIVEKLCDRIIIIKHGQIMAQKTLQQLQRAHISLEKFYMDIINEPGEPTNA
ncbi:MAG: YwaF family protein [Prevotella sp.]|nr:YwaF family protein [Prevotella sp.]